MQTAMRSAAPTRTMGDEVAAGLRRTALLVVACGAAGALVGGLGSRLLTDELGLGGTAALMLSVGFGSAVLGVGAFTILRPWLPRSPIARGLAFGAISFPLLGWSAVHPPADPDLALLGDPVVNVFLLSGLFVAFGLVASVTFEVLDGRVRPAAELSPRSWALTVLGALPVIPGVVGVVSALSPRLGLPLLGAWAATVVARSLARRRRHGLAHLVGVGATAALVVVVGLAGVDSVDAVRAIVARA
jgi:hypothetical protein